MMPCYVCVCCANSSINDFKQHDKAVPNIGPIKPNTFLKNSTILPSAKKKKSKSANGLE